MATLTQKPAAIIWVKDTNGQFHSINGITTAETTDTNAVNQLNKIFNIFGVTIVPNGIQRIITQEAN